MKRWLLAAPAWTYAVLATLAVLYLTLSTQPLPETDIKLFPGADKVVHFLMFCGLALAFDFDITRWRRSIVSIKTRIWVAVGSFILGGATEVIQLYLIEGRSGDMLDFGADLLGAASSILLFIPISRYFFKFQK